MNRFALPASITDLLQRWGDGEAEAFEQAIPLVYDELRRIAARTCRQMDWGATLQATELVHRAYVQLREAKPAVDWQTRAHFYGVAARLMRQILVDEVRRRSSLKRGGGVSRVLLEETKQIGEGRPLDLLSLDDALRDLHSVDPRKAEVVELRFFGGLTTDEISADLGIAPATVQREWRKARAWLYRALAIGA